MIEFQIILTVIHRDGNYSKHVVKASSRETGIQKYNYLKDLIINKKYGELKEWTDNNIHVQHDGIVSSIDGLYGTSYIQVLP